MRSNQSLTKALPYIFVPLWCTGFLVSPIATQYADPLTFLLTRFALTLLALGAVLLMWRAPFSMSAKTFFYALLSGALLHGLYLGGVWWSIARGMPSGLSAIIAGLQPILTALMAGLILNEAITKKQWMGILVGFVGVIGVIWPKLTGIGSDPIPLELIMISFASTLGITFGTLIQKKHLGGVDVRTSSFLQFLGAFIAMSPAVILLESARLEWNIHTVLAMSWAVGGLSLLAITILLVLIRTGSVARVITLLYLVPPITTLMAYFIYGETLIMLQIIGMLMTSFGVYLATNSKAGK